MSAKEDPKKCVPVQPDEGGEKFEAFMLRALFFLWVAGLIFAITLPD